MTLEELSNSFSVLQSQLTTNHFQVYMGELTAEFFHKQMREEVIIKPLLEKSNWAFAKNKITKEQHSTLKSMIMSPDNETVSVAESLLNQLEN